MNRKPRSSAPLSLFAFQDIITTVTGVFLMLTLLMALALTTHSDASSKADARQLVEQLNEAIAQTQGRVNSLRDQLARRRDQQLEDLGFTQRSADAAFHGAKEDVRLLRSTLQQLSTQIQEFEEELSNAEASARKRAIDRNRLEQLHEERAALDEELTELRNSQRVFYNDTDKRGREVLLVEMFADELLVASAGKSTAPLGFSGPQRTRSFLAWAQRQPAAEVRFVLIVHRGMTKIFNELRKELRSLGYSIGYDLLPEDKIAVDPVHGA